MATSIEMLHGLLSRVYTKNYIISFEMLVGLSTPQKYPIARAKLYLDYDLPISGGIYKTIRDKIKLILQGIDLRTLEQ